MLTDQTTPPSYDDKEHLVAEMQAITDADFDNTDLPAAEAARRIAAALLA